MRRSWSRRAGSSRAPVLHVQNFRRDAEDNAAWILALTGYRTCVRPAADGGAVEHHLAGSETVHRDSIDLGILPPHSGTNIIGLDRHTSPADGCTVGGACDRDAL